MKLTLPDGATGFTDDNGKWICTGSQMGRRNQLPDDLNAPAKMRLTRLPFVDDCYDRWGAYWGGPANVWYAWGDCADVAAQVFIRADSRSEAKGKVKAQLPNARFYR